MNQQTVGNSRESKRERQVFVAYPYRFYPRDDYRGLFERVGEALQVSFIFADEYFSATYLLEKITAMIVDSQFGIFDITNWNPNVSLEVGLALGLRERVFIAFDPTKTDLTDVPTDLRGRDRIEYASYTDFESKLARLISAELPIALDRPTIQIDELQHRVLAVLRADAGLYVNQIAAATGIKQTLTRYLLQELIESNLVHTDGNRRGMRYYKR